MILEIEYYKGDTRLSGRTVQASELKRQLKETESVYDKENDNYTELFCRMFGWSPDDTAGLPDYVYDRDTMRLYRPHNKA